jgi:hypothetical protein
LAVFVQVAVETATYETVGFVAVTVTILVVFPSRPVAASTVTPVLTLVCRPVSPLEVIVAVPLVSVIVWLSVVLDVRLAVTVNVPVVRAVSLNMSVAVAVT